MRLNAAGLSVYANIDFIVLPSLLELVVVLEHASLLRESTKSGESLLIGY